MHRANLWDLDLNLLVLLRELLQTRNLTETAQRVGRTQPAVSHALRRLREMFDDELLVRSGNQMLLTATAETLVGPLEAALSQVSEVVASRAEFDPRRLERVFQIGSTDFAELVLVSPALATIRRTAPGVAVTCVRPGDAVDRDIQEGRLCMAIGANFKPLSGLMVTPLFEETLVCVTRRDHPRIRRRLTLKQFLELEHALVAPRGRPGGIVDDRLAHMGARREVVFITPSFISAALAVSSSDMILTVPRRLAEQLARLAPLGLYPTPLELPPIPFGILFSEARVKDPGHRWLRQQLVAAARDHG